MAELYEKGADNLFCLSSVTTCAISEMRVNTVIVREAWFQKLQTMEAVQFN